MKFLKIIQQFNNRTIKRLHTKRRFREASPLVGYKIPNTKYSYLIIGSIFLLALAAFITLQLNTKQAEAAWYNTNWGFRQAITVTVPSNGADINNLETLITIANTNTLISAGKMQTACQDLRFTSQTGKLLPYYIDSGCNTSSAKVWVAVDKVPANTTTYTPVSYTHLRAHETGRNIVCRLL